MMMVDGNQSMRFAPHCQMGLFYEELCSDYRGGRGRSKSIQEYLREPYARILIPDALGGYSADIFLDFPGCFAQGETAHFINITADLSSISGDCSCSSLLQNVQDLNAQTWYPDASLHRSRPLSLPSTPSGRTTGESYESHATVGTMATAGV
jgi:hypothetical protein